jgi:hypothetical protein
MVTRATRFGDERAGVAHLVGCDEVASSNLDTRNAYAGGDSVEQALAHEIRLTAAGCAVGRCWRFVGQTEAAGRPIRGLPIRTRQNPAGHVGDAGSVRADVAAWGEQVLRSVLPP